MAAARTLKLVTTVCALLITLLSGGQAKYLENKGFPLEFKLADGDSFTVECKNDNGVIDRESVDVDAETWTINVPGLPTVVRKIQGYLVRTSPAIDRFGQLSGFNAYVAEVHYKVPGSKPEYNNLHRRLEYKDGAWPALHVDAELDDYRSLHEDGTWWVCTHPE
jgi:hypothetical protein